MIRGYNVEYDPKVDLYKVEKDDKHYMVKKNKGLYCYCKAIQVNGVFYLCRHKKMVLTKYFINKKYKRLFNISNH